MTIKQALKLKNKLVKEITEETQKMYQYNSVEEGSTRPYSSKESLENVVRLTNNLVTLKNAIHKANGPVYEKIFRLSELKSLVSKFKQIDCTEGKVELYRRSETIMVKSSEISVVERDNTVKKFEEEIEKLQDELDTHNAVTTIE